MAKTVLRYKNLTTPKQPGELARLRVLSGSDQGTLYVILSDRVSIGRGEENDIVTADLKMSRRHAEISYSGGLFQLRDLGSAHGIGVNGVAQKAAVLKSGDKLGLGESVMEFVASVESGATRMIQQPAPLKKEGLTQFIVRPGAGGGPANAAKVTGKASFVERNKKLIFMLGGLMLISVLLPSVEQHQKKKKAQYEEPPEVSGDRGISSLQAPNIDEGSKKQAEIYFKEGFREFRSRNYLRARVSFETALQIYPMHVQAHNYLEITKKTMETEAKKIMQDARKDEEANRLNDAQQKLAAVKRLYFRDQAHEIYKEATAKSEELAKKIKDAN